MKVDWIVNENFLDNSLCDDIINLCHEKGLSDGKIGNDVEGGVLDKDYRRSKTCFISPSEISNIYTSIVFQNKFLNKEYFNFDISAGIFEIQYSEYYGASLGKYDWHMDTFYKSSTYTDRKLSICIQLSDPSEYEGGNFEFKPPVDPLPSDVFRKRGSLITFPSFHVHRVSEVTKGIRRSLVMWVEGPKWR